MSFVRGRSVVHCLVDVLLLSGVLIATTSPASAGTLDATWTAPTTNIDGSQLADLASYRVYYGSGSSPCPGSAFISVASPTSSPASNQTVSLRLSGLVTGTTYFVAVTAIDTSGNESPCSTTASAAARAGFDVSPSGTVNFGNVSLGSSAVRTFTVSNPSGGTVSGTAIVAPPFTIVSGSPFTLSGAGASQAVTIRFTPATTATVSATVSFVASGATASRVVTGSGSTGGSGGGTGSGTGPAALTVSPISVGVGGTVTAAWSGIAAPTTTDWIGLYSAGASDGDWLGWIYVSCSQAPAAARAAGSCAFPIPGSVSPGAYELRLFAADGYTRLASGGTFTVTASSAVTLNATPTSVHTGGSVTAAWSRIAAPTATDWIGLYSAGASDGDWLGWIYVSCSQAPAAARAAGSCAFPIPGSLSPGAYRMRVVEADGYTRLASGGTFTVTASSAVTLNATPTSVHTGGSVTAAWSGIAAPTATDWSGRYSAGASDGDWLDWMYVSCSQAPAAARAAGSCAFPIPGSVSPGAYELRLFAADGYTRLASGTFTVTASSTVPSSAVNLSATPTSVRAGGSVTAAWSAIAAPTATDWIGLYSAGTSDGAFLGWMYVSCSQAPAAARASGSCAFPIPP